jgi:hypothetical protein
MNECSNPGLYKVIVVKVRCEIVWTRDLRKYQRVAYFTFQGDQILVSYERLSTKLAVKVE